ncbi:MAG TPA: NAD-dependent epimerase/dehydratase family protein [Candidatus Paceibacterota bacterium]|jgi:nucleoside-diphosphate-sugar epimerase|nr:NAD-dependent epimerase/dehydratase family protein [Verrucomicrobiota bacterium]OQC27231.1 MAG: UDP-glucose 4-epimerase [Verrucomicrobia bacterium ADurb.Bin063]HRY58177.1 NAD-dependent epimerase/dehydratase family protein [Candidatus Paceibacterota bacterium]HNR69974.1 NAD-dependent epimerase/dehydratase family protein [Verrucomicrobiota bacterium]HNS68619.1 NAD-dependent epimerase/dehydratase family protein [Verrucomicrobiota bacterium]
MQQKVLLLGGTGNISTACAAQLRQQGHEIYILSRGQTTVPPGYQPLRADRKDPAAMRHVLKSVRPDVVINFIGYDLPEVQIDCELFSGSVSQYVFISSAVVYAKPPARLPLTEDAPLGNPWWDYAQKKLACEQWLLQRRQETGYPVTIVRPSHTYSKLWVPNAVSSGSYTLAARLERGKAVFVHDDGESPWTLTAASDFAIGLAGLVGKPAAIGEAFHITSDEVLSWNQIYAEIAAAVGAEAPRVVKVPTDFICQVAPQMTGPLKGDKAHPGIFDNTKIKRLVPEFRCRKSFHTGVRESVQWLRAHPEQQNLRPELDALIENVITTWERQG